MLLKKLKNILSLGLTDQVTCIEFLLAWLFCVRMHVANRKYSPTGKDIRCYYTINKGISCNITDRNVRNVRNVRELFNYSFVPFSLIHHVLVFPVPKNKTKLCCKVCSSKFFLHIRLLSAHECVCVPVYDLKPGCPFPSVPAGWVLSLVLLIKPEQSVPCWVTYSLSPTTK